MEILKGKLKAFFHGLFHLHRIVVNRSYHHSLILTIQCWDCGKWFYKEKGWDYPFVHCEEMLGAEDQVFPKKNQEKIWQVYLNRKGK